mmetsp:Transcript_59844/g.106389  ORF Transcript_59844/g.106389 Transcript_59844/m.106389 type:complete len:412 (+) Transcript_59844:88-1323(+)
MTNEPPRFRDTACGHYLGAMLLIYGLFNTYLFIIFTPVYTATTCGQQKASLNKFNIGTTIQVGLQIQVVCENPNYYAVEIRNDTPGHVFVGRHRGADIGLLTLLEGSSLPAKGSGKIQVQMDTEISAETSHSLAEQFLDDTEIPLFLELQFNVGVNVNFGLLSFGTTAPFKKKCGMKLGGILYNSESKMGPMICRETFDGLYEQLPSKDAAAGDMSFSAAQMDPDRVRMGELLKNLSIVGIGSLCYIFGFILTWEWILGFLRNSSLTSPLQSRLQDAKDLRQGSSQPASCLRATSGNVAPSNQQLPKTPGLFGRLHNAIYPESRQSRTARSTEETLRPSALSGMARFLFCGGISRRGDIQPELAACTSGTSGDLSQFRSWGQSRVIRGRSGTLLDGEPQNKGRSLASFWGP